VGQTASVLRDGAPRQLPAREVVPGDVIRLSAGDLVPADARLLSAKDLFLNEAPLTGESLPREKHAQSDGAPAGGLGEALTAVFRGTSVVSGLGAAVVPASVANLGRRGVVYRELADRHPKLDLWLAWSRGALDKASREFVAQARLLAA